MREERVQAIRTLEPVFYDPLDGPAEPEARGNPEKLKVKKMKKQLNEERRSAARQLRRDANFMQSVKAKEVLKEKREKEAEKKRVWGLMDQHQADYKKMLTENETMDTSLVTYSKTKARKKANPRSCGNDPARPRGGKERGASGRLGGGLFLFAPPGRLRRA